MDKFDPKPFNEIFERNGLEEASNCETEADVLRTVEFVMQKYELQRQRLNAVKNRDRVIEDLQK